MSINMKGQRYGILTVTELAPRPVKNQGCYWWCRCDCGVATIARAKDLRNGNTASCGCLKAAKRPPSKGKGKGWRDPKLLLDINRPWRKHEHVDDRWAFMMGMRSPPGVTT